MALAQQMGAIASCGLQIITCSTHNMLFLRKEVVAACNMTYGKEL
jgi:hypothetical protein